ncbi:MAG TPA: glycosyltransferase family 4 protein [Candidatus Saccharimonadales bacterium]|nr:glycosyltransferase family 4 protein [Candidatus Saccharimonadales bacterium]
MKILMLGWELPPYNSGGLGIACYQLCKALSQKDIDIEFILPYQADHQIDFMTVTAANPQGIEAVLRAGIAYDSQRYVKRVDGGQETLAFSLEDQQSLYERTVERMVTEREVDIVHAHDWLTFRAGLRAKERLGCPLILHVHSVESDRSGSPHGNPLVKEIEGQSMLLADRIIAVSQHTKNKIIEDYGIPAGKIEVVHNSIDPAALQPLDSDNAYRYLTLMKQLGYRVVVNVGRLTIQKGLPNLLRAAKEVIERDPKVLFLIVGSGEQYYELIELAAELGIGPNVIFTDFQRGKRWRDAYGIGDLFVMPSISEPFGLTPLEAAGYGLPSLISKQSGVSEILHSCLKVDYWDINEMANQILAVLQHNDLHDELQAGAFREYQRLSWHDVSAKVLNLYQDHLAGAAA